MNPGYFSFLIVFLLLFSGRKKKRKYLLKFITQRSAEEITAMLELAKRFMNKDCIIYYAFDNQLQGIIKEVTDSAVLLEREDGSQEIVNPAFIIRIREHPKDKKGKKKSVVLD